MANIPVERTGTPVWIWLIGLVVLAGGIWLVAELFDNEPDADEIAGTDDNIGLIDDFEIEPGADEVDGAVITSEAQLYADDDGLFETDAGLADGAGGRDDVSDPRGATRLEGVTVTRLQPGTRVDLPQTRVLSVIGDSAFWIGQDDARRYLVVLAGLGESETGAGGSDGVFNVDEGDTVRIDGAIARFDDDGAPGLSELTDDDTAALRERNTYIRVTSREAITVSG